MNNYGIFQEVPPAAVKPSGALRLGLCRQNDGISSHYQEQGYPFNTPMWNGGVGKVILESVICHDEASETPMQESWWPYEQSAYLLDGLVRLGVLLDDQEKIALFEKNLRYVIERPDENGLLGHCYNESTSEWPMAVFFRAAYFYYQVTGDQTVKDAFIRHFKALTPEKLSNEFRNINNLEGLLKVYGWTGDRELLSKAIQAYQLHNQRNLPPVENEFELFWARLTSGRNFVIHGVSFCESLKLPVMLSLYSGDSGWLEGAEKALQKVLELHEQIPGLTSSNEDFAGRDPLQGYETCDITDFTWTLGYFLMATGKAEYADRIEKIIYNALPASVSKDFCTLQYLSAPNQVIAADYSNHSFFFRGSATFRQFRSDHSAQCCTGNIHRALPNFALRLWMKDATGAPVAAMYGSSVFTGDGYSIEEETNYPYSSHITFKFNMAKAQEMPFTFRIPGWCQGATAQLNDETLALNLKSGEYFTLKRCWQDGDVLKLTLPMAPVQIHDRQWSHFEYGPLVFALPVASQEERQGDTAFAPRNFLPRSKWSYGVAPGADMKVLQSEDGRLSMKVTAFPVTGFDNLEQGRYTPEVPLFCQQAGDECEIELIPYGETTLRITAFPDARRRKVLPIYQVLTTESYPYDINQPLEAQVYPPESMTAQELIASATAMQMDRSGYYDLLHHLGDKGHAISYMLFRVWADEAGEAVFAVGASDGAECFLNGEKVYTIEPPFDGEFMAPCWIRGKVKAGYNLLMLKVCEGNTLLQYRKAWGARVDVFQEA